MIKNLLITLMAIASITITAKAELPYELEGATIVANDGQFLGVITTDRLDSKSILNPIGEYGNRISSTSIFNQIGEYGGEISSNSPFNPITSTPPKIYTKDGKWGYLTVNRTLQPRIDPYWLIGVLGASE